MLETCIGLELLFVCNDGRVFIGILEGADLQWNVAISDCKERIFEENQPTQTVQHGCLMLRGDSLGVVGVVDRNKEPSDWTQIQADPLKPLIKYQ
jgi:small nuclear ribonucleoprotein (snRNP)-like protein